MLGGGGFPLAPSRGADEASPAACRQLMAPEGTFGMVWGIVGFSQDRATTYQSIQMPAGHRPIELEAAPTMARTGR